MEIDTDKIDEAVLALLQLTRHEKFRAWKGHDWDALDRLYSKGMISDPVGRAKSVALTDVGQTPGQAVLDNADDLTPEEIANEVYEGLPVDRARSIIEVARHHVAPYPP